MKKLLIALALALPFLPAVLRRVVFTAALTQWNERNRTMLHDYPLTLEQARADLRAQAKASPEGLETIVGTTNSETQCPIAQIIRRLTGAQAVLVDAGGIQVDGACYLLPAWIGEYLPTIDLADLLEEDEGAYVTARVALEALQEVEATLALVAENEVRP